jgi:hypothetical protein
MSSHLLEEEREREALTTVSAMVSKESDGEDALTRMTRNLLFKFWWGDHIEKDIFSLFVLSLIGGDQSIDQTESIQDEFHRGLSELRGV